MCCMKCILRTQACIFKQKQQSCRPCHLLHFRKLRGVEAQSGLLPLPPYRAWPVQIPINFQTSWLAVLVFAERGGERIHLLLAPFVFTKGQFRSCLQTCLAYCNQTHSFAFFSMCVPNRSRRIPTSTRTGSIILGVFCRAASKPALRPGRCWPRAVR